MEGQFGALANSAPVNEGVSTSISPIANSGNAITVAAVAAKIPLQSEAPRAGSVRSSGGDTGTSTQSSQNPNESDITGIQEHTNNAVQRQIAIVKQQLFTLAPSIPFLGAKSADGDEVAQLSMLVRSMVEVRKQVNTL